MSHTQYLGPTPIHREPFMWSLPNEEPYATGDLIHSARRIGESIQQIPGFAPGRHVILRMPAGVEYAASILGCWLARAVPSPINIAAMPDETAHCTSIVNPLAIIHCGSVPVPDDMFPGTMGIDAEPLTGRLPPNAPLPQLFDVDPAVDAMVLFTSGSTGRPKGVRLTHRGLMHSLRGLASAIKPDHETFLLQVPMHHVFGIVTFLLSFSTGSRVVCLPDFRADAILDAIQRFSVTIGFGPPEMFLSLARHPHLDRYDLKSFSRLLLGGSPCRKPQILEIEKGLGLSTVFLSFGMTETTGGISLAPFRDSNGQESIHAGRPVDTIQVAAFSQNEQLPTREVGEIRFRGPHLMRGYVGDADLDPDTWVASGDLGCIDASGLLHVTGRIKDIIIKAGENISIAEVENVLLSNPNVKDVCVVGIPDDRLGENVAAAIVTDRSTPDKRELQKFCLTALPKSRIPQKMIFIDALPKLSTGKVDRTSVGRLFSNPGMVSKRASE